MLPLRALSVPTGRMSQEREPVSEPPILCAAPFYTNQSGDLLHVHG